MDEDNREDRHIRLQHFKVKINTLAAEARIIRQAERKACKRGLEVRRRSLHEHRVDHVRVHARHNHLAYGFLRGVEYQDMEHRCHEKPDWTKVKDHAKTFCQDREWRSAWPAEWEARWQDWLSRAKAHIAQHEQAVRLAG